MQRKEEESLETYVIPENFVDTGRCFNGMFKTRNLLEAILFDAGPAYLCLNANLPFEQKTVLTILVAGSIAAFMLAGINGESVLEFIGHGWTYRKNKRVAKYNPRVKSEAKPGYLVNEKTELPRDKVIKLIAAFKRDKTDSEEAVSRDIYDPVYQEFFADDLGYVETPDDLKTKKELRAEARARKKELRAKAAKEKAEKKAVQKRTEQKNRKELRALKKSAKKTDKAIRKERARIKKAEKRVYRKGDTL